MTAVNFRILFMVLLQLPAARAAGSEGALLLPFSVPPYVSALLLPRRIVESSCTKLVTALINRKLFSTSLPPPPSFVVSGNRRDVDAKAVRFLCQSRGERCGGGRGRRVPKEDVDVRGKQASMANKQKRKMWCDIDMLRWILILNPIAVDTQPATVRSCCMNLDAMQCDCPVFEHACLAWLSCANNASAVELTQQIFYGSICTQTLRCNYPT